MNKITSNKIYNLNFVLIIMIVILHSTFDAGSEKLVFLFNTIGCICDMATPTFFALSAYLFFRNFSYKKYNEKLKKRFSSLLIPYFLWSIVLFIYYYIVVHIPGINSIFHSNIDFAIKAIPYNILNASCAFTMWFVRCLIVFVIFSPFIYFILKNKTMTIISILVSIIINIYFSIGYSNPLFWLPVYLIGGFLSVHYKSYVENNKYRISIYKVFFCITFCILLMMAIISDQYSPIYYIYRCFSPVFIYIIYEIFFNINTNKIEWSKYSFWIFCTHISIIQVIENVLLYFGGKNDITIIICFFLTIILTVTLCIITAKMVERICPKIYNIMVGNRK